jgi:hypothetical protein
LEQMVVPTLQVPSALEMMCPRVRGGAVGSISRRQFVTGTAGLAVLAGATSRRLGWIAQAADTGVSPALVWREIAHIETSTPGYRWPSLMRVDGLLSSPRAKWYMWASQHGDEEHGDTPVALWTAADPAGPWSLTPQVVLDGMASVGTPTPNYVVSHFAAPDIGWDSTGKRFIANPHSIRTNGYAEQDSFLIESPDGVTWHWLDNDNSPRLICGGDNSPDAFHTGYGRLLKTLDGRLVTAGARYWWLYSARRYANATGKGGAAGDRVVYRPWLASSTSLSAYPWIKQPTLAFDTVPEGSVLDGVPEGGVIRYHDIFEIGTFAQAAGQYWAVYGSAVDKGYPGGDLVRVGGASSPTTLDAAQQAPVARIPNSQQTTLTWARPSGGNVYHDASTGKLYLTTADAVQQVPNTSSGSSQSLAPTVITIYEAVSAP